MAILDIEKYYYFKLRNGSPYSIKESVIRINTAINRLYVEMTEEQREFYLANPTASVMEVWNCELVPPYVPPTPDVQEYAAQKVKELKEACYGSVTVTSLEFAMASDKLDNITADSYYSFTDAQKIVTDFRTQSKKAMQVFDTYKTRIEAAVSVESVDLTYNEAMEAL